MANYGSWGHNFQFHKKRAPLFLRESSFSYTDIIDYLIIAAINGAIIKAIVLITLIKALIAGPAVSL